MLGDPDWRILVTKRESFATGVKVGYTSRLPRTPAAYERKVQWRRHGPEELALDLRPIINRLWRWRAIAAQIEEEARLGVMRKMPWHMPSVVIGKTPERGGNH